MTPSPEAAPRRLPAAITLALVSAATIAAQIALIRALSVDTYHHFTYLVIGTALLGFGAGGTALSLLNHYIPGWWQLGAPITLMGLTISLSQGYRLSVATRPDLQYLLYQFSQVGRLWLTTLILFLPFFFAGLFVGLVLFLFRDRPGPVYGTNMVASGVGAAGGVALAALFGGPRGLVLLSLIAAAGLLVWLVGAQRWSIDAKGRRWINAAALLALLAGPTALLLPPAGKIDQYKAMAQAERLAIQGGAEHLLIAQSPTARLDIYDAPSMRYTLFAAPLAPAPPEQHQLFLDGYHTGALFQIKEPDAATILRYVPQSLAYAAVESPRVLLLGERTGANVWLALLNGAREIVVVQENWAVEERVLAQGRPPFDREEVEVVTVDPRTYLERETEPYDLIQIVSAEGVPATAGGLASLREDYLLTVEALGGALELLTPTGVLAVTRGLQTPARDNIRLFALLTEALREEADLSAKERLLQGHNYLAGTTITSRLPFGEERLEAIRRRAEELSMDLDYFPGIRSAQLTSRAAIPGPEGEPGSYLHHAAMSLLSPEPESFYDRWVYNVRPPRDEKPYFHNFFRPASLPRILEAYASHWFQRIELGVVVVVVTLVQVALAGVVLILLPLAWLPKKKSSAAPGGSERGWSFLHFGAIGVGFMLLEMLFIQRLTRFLGSPVYATAVVLAAILLFSGIGSTLQQRIPLPPERRVRLGSLTMLALILISQLGLDPVLTAAVTLPLPLRLLTALLLLAPVSLVMGVQMPGGLELLAARQRELIPFAWAVNGVASVVAAPLAVLLAVSAGFTTVSLVALVCYGGVYVALPLITRAGAG
jgi:hypothetical protein